MKIIGMIHLGSLIGYPQHVSMTQVINDALADARELIAGDVDMILLENTDDDPHQKIVSPEIISAYTLVASKVREVTDKPLGICVLWNDYKAALAIAKTINAEFVRIPVFVDTAVTASGIIEGNPYDVISYRKHINAENIKIYCDIQVKHAGHLVNRAIEDLAAEALHFQADGVIITGKKTGDMPVIDDLKKVREHLSNALILVGSGTTPENVNELAEYADYAIIGTFFKENNRMKKEKVKKLLDTIKK